MSESLQPPPMLRDVMADEGISWARLVTAIVFLGLSLAIGHQTAPDPPRPEAVPQPVRERVATGVDLPPLQQAVVHAPLQQTVVAAGAPLQQAVVAAPLQFSSVPALASAARPKPAGRTGPLRLGERRQIVRAANRPSARQAVRQRQHDVAVAARESGTIRRSLRTRAQVRREYLRTRHVVAALTGEDSGSDYLMRLAARQRAARLDGAGRRRR